VSWHCVDVRVRTDKLRPSFVSFFSLSGQQIPFTVKCFTCVGFQCINGRGLTQFSFNTAWCRQERARTFRNAQFSLIPNLYYMILWTHILWIIYFLKDFSLFRLSAFFLWLTSFACFYFFLPSLFLIPSVLPRFSHDTEQRISLLHPIPLSHSILGLCRHIIYGTLIHVVF